VDERQGAAFQAEEQHRQRRTDLGAWCAHSLRRQRWWLGHRPGQEVRNGTVKHPQGLDMQVADWHEAGNGRRQDVLEQGCYLKALISEQTQGTREDEQQG
jgi:hypothetical protein